jgi:predicted metal-dependent phosphoesterase TrpH
MASTLRVDLHVHTWYSKDSLMSPEEIVRGCQAKGLSAVAITDHNTIAGALALRDIAPFPVIVGQEISTTHGEVMGLFLEGEVPRDLSPGRTVEFIKEQGGLAGVPHPFDRLRGETLARQSLEEIAGRLDFIEGLNSRVTLSRDNRRARAFARSRGLPCTSGSDAHSLYELGRGYMKLLPFHGKNEFLESLASGRIAGNLSPFFVHFLSIFVRMRRRSVRG